MSRQERQTVMVWDVAIRLWHWLFAISLCTALTTGYFSELADPKVHGIAGITTFCLLIFRLVWGIMGSRHVRWTQYWTTPAKVISHFVRGSGDKAHTAPGILLALALLTAVLFQATSGLFTTDDIFLEGPLYQFVEDEFSSFARSIHLKAWWFVLAFIATHVLAHLTYLALRDPMPLSMFHGKKQVVGIPAAEAYPFRAILCFVIASAVFFYLYRLFD